MRAEGDHSALKVLVLGGSGVFGSRIARLIAADPAIEVIIGGRDLARAEKTALQIQVQVPGAKVSARKIDSNGDEFYAELRQLNVGLVINAVGPFRGQDYTVAQAAIACRAHYLDLADDRDFVERFRRLNKAAIDADCVALTGVSSVPALSSTVVASLAEGLARVSEIRIGITPGNRGPRGLAVVKTVLMGVGQPSEQLKAGAWLPVRGWQDTHRRTLKVEGRRTLKRRFSHVEVPDPDFLHERYPAARTITFHAGLELGFQHLGLCVLSALVERGWIKNAAIFAAPLEWLAQMTKWMGRDEGGMFVEVIGRDLQRQWVKRCWTLHAASGDGPMIPAMASAILAKEIAAGIVPAPGARAAIAAIKLSSVEEMMAGFDIKTERRDEPLAGPLYAILLGRKSTELPNHIRDMHFSNITARYGGGATVKRGKNIVSRFAGWLLGMPKASESMPVTVTITPDDSGELWQRTFGTRSFSSRMSIVERRNEKLLREKFGPFEFDFKVDCDDKHLAMAHTRTRFFGLPWLKFLGPRIKAEERVERGRFIFDVRANLPLLGLLVHYTGWLVPLSTATALEPRRQSEGASALPWESADWQN
ncbi:MAG: DUF4166 domain-containing protein [Alphaproteobacteria bacterium]